MTRPIVLDPPPRSLACPGWCTSHEAWGYADGTAEVVHEAVLLAVDGGWVVDLIEFCTVTPDGEITSADLSIGCRAGGPNEIVDHRDAGRVAEALTQAARLVDARLVEVRAVTG